MNRERVKDANALSIVAVAPAHLLGVKGEGKREGDEGEGRGREGRREGRCYEKRRIPPQYCMWKRGQKRINHNS